MLSYETQLDLKRDVVVKAYRNFSGMIYIYFSAFECLLFWVTDLPDSLIPPILETIASPLQYGYRTKLTPHFEAPPKKYQNGRTTTDSAGNVIQPDWLKIGFNHIGKRNVMDIEVWLCPC
jgi:tRNA (uracil-5-)-methyltransferase